MAGNEKRFDVIVIGAGVVGSSVAMGSAERRLKTLAVDIDLSGRLSSSEKNAGGVRATWWQRVNIALCRASIEYYQRVRDEVGFRQKGYLWLYDKDTFARAVEHIPLQRELGHQIEALTPADVNRRVPEIDKLDGIAGATFSPADGLINPNLLKEHYRARALKLGAQFLDRTYVVAHRCGRIQRAPSMLAVRRAAHRRRPHPHDDPGRPRRSRDRPRLRAELRLDRQSPAEHGRRLR